MDLELTDNRGQEFEDGRIMQLVVAWATSLPRSSTQSPLGGGEATAAMDHGAGGVHGGPGH